MKEEVWGKGQKSWWMYGSLDEVGGRLEGLGQGKIRRWIVRRPDSEMYQVLAKTPIKSGNKDTHPRMMKGFRRWWSCSSNGVVAERCRWGPRDEVIPKDFE